MNKAERFQNALAEFSAATKEITGVTITHVYVNDTEFLLDNKTNPFKIVLEGVKINHGKGI